LFPAISFIPSPSTSTHHLQLDQLQQLSKLQPSIYAAVDRTHRNLLNKLQNGFKCIYWS
jgi:hypothetical protein